MIETMRSEHPCQAPKWKILNATTIKLIAVLLMAFDHIHQMYAWNGAPLWLTILGRPVFPMFLFISAESFHYTQSEEILNAAPFCQLGNDHYNNRAIHARPKSKHCFDEQRIQHILCYRIVYAILGLVY